MLDSLAMPTARTLISLLMARSIMKRVAALVAGVTLVLTALASQAHAESPGMRITGFASKPELRPILGTAWRIFIDGPIEANSGRKLEEFIQSKQVPGESHVLLNSRGGNLFGGMELGRVIRKYNLRTDIGRQGKADLADLPSSGPGECHSACTLAFLVASAT
jgi:hypothetical protein